MKFHRSAEVLLFINLLYLHCLPNYCDIKQDVSIPSESSQTHKDLPTDPSRIGNVPSQQKEAKKVHLGLKNIQKENVQSNVEYVNNIPKEKDMEQFVDRIGRIDHAHVQKLKLNEAGLKSSRATSEPHHETVNNFESDKQAKSRIGDAIKQTEPLSSESVSMPHVKVSSSEKILRVSKPSTPEAATAAEAVVDEKLADVLHASILEQEKIEDNVHQHYDGMPSFDEWKKMMLAEQERGGQKVPSPIPPGKKISSQKRRRNYSSYECGAKIVAANNEAEGTSRILNELVDEYMLNPCKAKIWFVIELCETVQASQIELANFELFSSCPKDFAVYSSDNFPSRDWALLGTFTAAEQRVLQSFELKQEGFGKFIKIELQSHYGEEHYCPLSVVRIFGTSMVDEYEEMETLSRHSDIPDDDLDRLDMPIEDTKSTNIFGSATDAVMNIVKKAAQALGQQPIDEKKNETSTDTHNTSELKVCSVVDSSSENCKDILNVENALPILNSFPVSPTSMQQSFFRLLHRCDQCASSRIRYYSSAQPHCRFFQAALGPVVFQALCDWFKENPLAVAHESPAPGKNIPSDTFVISPTKSPPPQIIRIPSDRDVPLTELLNDSLPSVDVSDQSITVNVTTSPIKTNKSAPVQDKIVLHSSIMPTETVKSGHISSIFNESIKTSPGSFTKESNAPSGDSLKEQFIKASNTVPEKIEKSGVNSISETATLSLSEYTSSNEVLTESEQQQINELFSDSNTMAPDDLSIEIVPATELPQTFKTGDEKVADTRHSIQSKQEPVAASITATAGQKESVFMRMSNRIKALEINMSLSSQYLQELSQRYRRQMDEMQRAFNRTIGTLNDTARKAAEKDLKQQEILNSLQLQVSNLTETVAFLLNERTSVFRQMVETHVCLMFIEAIIMITIMSLCVRRISNTKPNLPENRTPILSPSRLSKRRNSADSCSPPVARKVKKRSNSEENISAEDLLIIEPLPVLLDPILRVKKRNRKRNKGMNRSISHPTVQCHSTSLCPEKPHTHSDGCMLCNVKIKQQQQPNKPSHTCENCDNNICTALRTPSKERRPNSIPLQNLTNGSIISSEGAKNNTLKNKDRFSFKKFLKFQKRDSI